MSIDVLFVLLHQIAKPAPKLSWPGGHILSPHTHDMLDSYTHTRSVLQER